MNNDEYDHKSGSNLTGSLTVESVKPMRSAADSVADAFSGQLVRVQADLAEARAKTAAVEAELERAHTDAVANADAKQAEIAAVRRDAAIREAAAVSGLVDMDCLQLLDCSSISVANDGTVLGVNEAFSTLKSNKPFLFSNRDGESRGNGTARAAVTPRAKSPVLSSVRDMTDGEYASSLKKIAPSYSRRYN